MLNFSTTAATGNASDDADPDGDGMDNVREYVSGTNPHDSASVFRISSIERSQDGWKLGFPTVTGKLYRLESSPELDGDTWSTVRDNIPGTGDVVEITDTAITGHNQIFYRALTQP